MEVKLPKPGPVVPPHWVVPVVRKTPVVQVHLAEGKGSHLSAKNGLTAAVEII